MSVIIKGVGMPSNCDDCKMRIFALPGVMLCGACNANVTNQQYAKERHERCPMIAEIRDDKKYIDADRLLAFLDTVAHSGETVPIDAVIDTIKNAPDIRKVKT